MGASPVIEIPGYTVLRLLGHGGMATVYLALQQSLRREVALKILSPALAQDSVATERFLREARISAKLHHPHIVAIYDVGLHDGVPYMSIAYEPGGTVASKTQSRGEPKIALRIVRDIASALDYAHSQGVIHRDVKPENILLRNDGTCVLSDFGIAHAVESAQAGLTREGTSVGTPHYMSPEQLRGEHVDGRSDIYSLGVVFYQLLTGDLPYQGTDGWAIGMQHISAPVPHLPPNLAYLQTFLDALLAKDPGRRLQSGAEVVQWVDARLSGQTAAMTVAMPTPLPNLTPGGSRATSASIAILPFADLSQGKDQEYLADGLTEELLGLLSKVPGLVVASRSSAASFKGKSAKPADIGRELKVATVLEGSLRKFGERVRISVQLINVEDGFQRWSETYDRQLTDVFAVQDEIAALVVASLKEQLLPKQAPAIDPEIERQLAIGRERLQGKSRKDAVAAFAAFAKVLALAPGHADAQAGSDAAQQTLAQLDDAEEELRAAREAEAQRAAEQAAAEAREREAAAARQRELAEKVAAEAREREAAERRQREEAERAAAEAQQREAAERAAAEARQREEAERAAAGAREREAAERAAAEARQREVAERAALETQQREMAARAAALALEREAAERAESEARHREAAERAAVEARQREAADRTAVEARQREAADRTAAEARQRETADRAAAEARQREAAEQAAAEARQREAAGRVAAEAALQEATSKVTAEFDATETKTQPPLVRLPPAADAARDPATEFASAYRSKAAPGQRSAPPGTRGPTPPRKLLTPLTGGIAAVLVLGLAGWLVAGYFSNQRKAECGLLLSQMQAATDAGEFDKAAGSIPGAEDTCTGEDLTRVQALNVLIQAGQTMEHTCSVAEDKARDLLDRGLPALAGGVIEPVKTTCASRPAFAVLEHRYAAAESEAKSLINRATSLMTANALVEAQALLDQALKLDSNSAEALKLREDLAARQAKSPVAPAKPVPAATPAESAAATAAAQAAEKERRAELQAKLDAAQAARRAAAQKPTPPTTTTVRPEPVAQLPTPPVTLPTPSRPEPGPAPAKLVPASTPQPTYPPQALRSKVSGEVTVSFTVNPNGSVSDVRIISASPRGTFDRAVITAVGRWRFQPIDHPQTATRSIQFKP